MPSEFNILKKHRYVLAFFLCLFVLFVFLLSFCRFKFTGKNIWLNAKNSLISDVSAKTKTYRKPLKKAKKRKPRSVSYLAIGNSLTRHSAVPDLWWGSRGMASSDVSTDFVHLTSSSLKRDLKRNVKLTISNVGNANGSWENSTSAQRKKLSDKLARNIEKSGGCDFVTIQFGENITDQKHLKTFKGDLKYLIRKIRKTRETKKGPKKNNSTEICLVGTFWLNSKERKKTDELKKEVAKEEKIDYVSLKKIAGNFHYIWHKETCEFIRGRNCAFFSKKKYVFVHKNIIFREKRIIYVERRFSDEKMQ